MEVNHSKVDPINVGVHLGNVLGYLSQTYGDGYLVIREAVQNAIDKGAKNIFVDIDCPRLGIKVYDDGNGASYDEIAKKFQKIGLSLKIGQADQFGEKGIGNLAGVAVAQEWQLLTKNRENPADVYRLYTFRREEMAKDDKINVWCEKAPQIKRISGCTFSAQTMVRLIGVDQVTLGQLHDQATISRTLTDAFGTKLRVRRINLHVSYRDAKEKTHSFLVKAPQFRGVPIDSERYDTTFGYVDFSFFHSPRPVANPSVLVVHKGNYSISLGDFFKRRILSSEIETLFAKGYFEGEIKLGFCELTPDRMRFVQNDELAAFVKAVETFVEEILHPIIEQLDQEGREDKHRKIAETLLRKVKIFFRKHPNFLPASLVEQTLEKDTGGKKESAKERTLHKNKKAGPHKHRQSLEPNAFKKQREKSRGGAKKESYSIQLREGIGIEMVYPTAEDGFLWHSRNNSGLIEINTANIDFLDAEKRGATALKDYMLLLLLKELTFASLGPIEAHAFGVPFEQRFMNFWRISLD